MQVLTCYVNASATLGVVRDSTNSKNASAPTLTRGMAVELKLRLFADGDSTTAYDYDSLTQIASWRFVMDTDFNEETEPKLASTHSEILLSQVEENGITYTEFSIPIPETNTVELNELLGTKETVSSLNGELSGYDDEGAVVFVLQIKSFTVRNRIDFMGTPTEMPSDYLTEAQVRAIINAGFEVIFAETNSEDPADWHSEQTTADCYFRMRLRGDTREWTEGTAEENGWSDAVMLASAGAGGTATTIPTASPDTLGGVKVGDGLLISEDGVLSIDWDAIEERWEEGDDDGGSDEPGDETP